jgi:hypothetical protein
MPKARKRQAIDTLEYLASLLFVFIVVRRKTFEIKGFKLLIDRIAESKGVTHDEILAKLNANEGPSLSHVTETANKEITDRMTDTTQYT